MKKSQLIKKFINNINFKNSLESKNNSGISNGEIEALIYQRKFNKDQIKQSQKYFPIPNYIG